jgi:hypothetical protein
MNVEHRGGGAPNREPAPSEAKRPENNQPTLEVGEGRHGVPPPGEHQQPNSDVEKKELQPPTERLLPFEPNLSGHDQQSDTLDPETERRLRAYAEDEAEGDPKKAEQLFKRYRKNSALIEFFKNGPTPLAYGPHPPKKD